MVIFQFLEHSAEFDFIYYVNGDFKIINNKKIDLNNYQLSYAKDTSLNYFSSMFKTQLVRIFTKNGSNIKGEFYDLRFSHYLDSDGHAKMYLKVLAFF